MKRVALVTCVDIPEPDVDEDLLLLALRDAGMEAELLAWDDPAGRPQDYDLCVLRSCWNYPLDTDGFLRWIAETDARSRLVNPAGVVRWNIHKCYLRELEDAGVPIIPTAWFERGAVADLSATMIERGWDDVVVKPAVSAGSYRTRRFRADSSRQGQAFLDHLVRDRDVMVQRFMADVEQTGERALVWIDGEFTHAVVKTLRLDADDESVSDAVPVVDVEKAFGEKAMTCVVGSELLYARVDLVRDDEGAPVLSELELIEPSLFLLQHPPALQRLVTAIGRLATE